MKSTKYKLKAMKKIAPFTCKTLIKESIINITEIKKPILINFWSITCNYSIDEMVNINNKVICNYNDKVLFLFINCGDSIGEINDFVNKNTTKASFKNFIIKNICVDYDDYITSLLGISDIPTSIIIDKELTVRHILIGKNREDKYINCLDSLFSVDNNPEK